MAKREIKVEVTQQSFKKFQDLFDKFNIKWDEKVFKSTDKLNERLRALNKSIHEWNRAIEQQRSQQLRKEIDDIRKGKSGQGGFQGTFTTDMFTNLNDVLAKVVESMEKMKEGIGDTTEGHWEEKKALSEEKTERDIHVKQMQKDIKNMQSTNRMKEAQFLRDTQIKKQEMMMQRHATEGWSQMFGSWNGVFKQLLPQMQELFQPMMNQGKFNEYMESGEGQLDKLEYEKMSDPTSRFAKEEEMRKKGGFTGSIEENTKKGQGIMGKAMGKIGNIMGMGQKGGIGGMAQGLGGAKGLMMLGGAMAGIKIIQKGVQLAIASSPMMQQMLKLWKFGIMMIFRPLGDFFGFFLRPIFVYMLRKFIIPFYQTFLPIMQKMGQDLGESVVGILEWIFGGIEAIASFFGKSIDKNEKHQATIEGKLDTETATLVSTGTAITDMIQSSTNSRNQAMKDENVIMVGEWQKFADKFPDAKAMDVTFANDKVVKNLPLTEEAIEFYRNINKNMVTPTIDAKGTGRGNNVFQSGSQNADLIENIKNDVTVNNTITTTVDREEVKQILEEELAQTYEKVLNKRPR